MSLLSYRDGRFFSGYGAGGGQCNSPSSYVQGRGCCLDPKFRPPGAPKKIQCCAVSKHRIVTHKSGGKTYYSMSCKPGKDDNGGNGGESGDARITAVSGNSVTLSKPLYIACPAAKPNLEMRRHATGLAEFVGTVESRSGSTYSLSFGTLPSGTKPKVGETVYLWCANGGGEDGIIGGIGDAIGGVFGGDGIPSWAIIGGIGLAAYFLFFNKPTVVAAK